MDSDECSIARFFMHGDERWLTYAALAISMIDREDIWRGLRKCMYNDLELVKFNQSVF